MRFINIKLFVLAAILSLTSISAMADNKSGKPLSCPPASAVASIRMVYAERDKEDPSVWIMTNLDEKSILSAKWFYIAVMPTNQAVNEQDAINKMNAVMPTVKAINNKIIRVPPTRFVGCGYVASGDYAVIAVTHQH